MNASFVKNYLTLFFILIIPTIASANDRHIIIADFNNNQIQDEFHLLDTGDDFYSLEIKIDGKNTTTNNNLIPTGKIRNNGGLEIFRGAGYANNTIVINFYFCSPSDTICYDRHIFLEYKDNAFSFTREQTTAFSGNFATTSNIYKTPNIPISSLTYQFLLENNKEPLELFTKKYGTCISSLSGDSVSTIIDELEKVDPREWIYKPNCLTPLLINDLLTQGAITEQASQRYMHKKIEANR